MHLRCPHHDRQTWMQMGTPERVDQSELDPSDAAPPAPRRSGAWHGLWCVLIVLLVVSLWGCVYRVLKLGGLEPARADQQFQSWGLTTLLVIIAIALCIGVRALHDGSVLDPRSGRLTRFWYVMRGRK
jgi:hypothetical protein